MHSQENQGPASFRPSQGHYLYADYSPLEDHRNLVDIIKDFVGLTADIAKISQDNKKLGSLLYDTDKLRDDITAAIKEIRKNTSDTMEKFYDTHSDVLATDLLKAGTVVLNETRESLSTLLEGTQENFLGQHLKHKEEVLGQISENSHRAYQLVQAWLANDYDNLPEPLLGHLVETTEVSLAGNHQTRKYDGWRTVSSLTAGSRSSEPAAPQQQGGKDPGEKKVELVQFSYTFQIDASELEFWSHRRTVSDLGIKDLAIPVGMKEPMSEKIKQSFRFGLGKDSGVSMEPELVKVDDYSISRVILKENRTLILELVGDPDRQSSTSRLGITYDMRSFMEQPSSSPRTDAPEQGQLQQKSGPIRPRIDYTAPSTGEFASTTVRADLLQMQEIEEASDLLKIQLLGSAVLAKLGILQKTGLVGSRGTLKDFKVGEASVLAPPNGKRELGCYSELFGLLESIASSFAPYVKKMKETTPVKGELMIRQDLGGGQRKEFSVRIDDLRSRLENAEYGTRIVSTLGI